MRRRHGTAEVMLLSYELVLDLHVFLCYASVCFCYLPTSQFSANLYFILIFQFIMFRMHIVGIGHCTIQGGGACFIWLIGVYVLEIRKITRV